MPQRTIPVVIVTASMLSVGCTPAPEPADLLLHNGKIVTVDDASSVHTAIVVKDGKVAAVGGDDLLNAYTAARVVDLNGRAVVPGFNDTHVHVSGQARRSVALAASRSIADIGRRIAEKAAELGPGEWVTGSGWAEDNLEEGRRPLMADLDAAAPNNPVIIVRAGSHSSVANSAALKLAGIARRTPDPDKGVIEHDDGGELNGVLRESATTLVTRLVPPATPEELSESFVQTLRGLPRLGLTSVIVAGSTTAGIATDEFGQWQDVYQAHGDELPRAVVQIKWQGLDTMKAFGRKTGDGNDRLKVGAIKVVVDGGFTGPAAYTIEPYKGQPNYRGLLNFTEAELYDLVKAAHGMGWQMGIHAIGDGAIKMTVEILARVLRESPRADHRHYLNHFTIPPPEETLDQMLADEILIAQQPNFTYTLEQRYADNLDGYRLSHNNPLRTPMKKGLFMAFGSDNLPVGPLVGLYAAVTRKGRSGRVWGPDEGITMAEAIRAYTRNSAFVTRDEATKGTLEPGKLADLVVLGQDILTIDPEKVKDTTVDLTIIGGKVVYERTAELTTP